jgi:class 3 adenylate cyclase
VLRTSWRCFGSTKIAASLDAEEWRDLVGGYLDAASAAVTEMGGHIAKKLGEGGGTLMTKVTSTEIVCDHCGAIIQATDSSAGQWAIPSLYRKTG